MVGGVSGRMPGLTEAGLEPPEAVAARGWLAEAALGDFLAPGYYKEEDIDYAQDTV